MPTRLIREGINSSERVNALDLAEEVFYRRLLNVVDDYGRYSAHPARLRTSCYPLRAESVTESDIEKSLHACTMVGLVRIYEGKDGKSYLVVRDFRQQVRAKFSPYPEPPPDPLDDMLSRRLADATQTLSTCLADAKQTPQSDEVSLTQAEPILNAPAEPREKPEKEAPKPKPKPPPKPVPPSEPAPPPKEPKTPLAKPPKPLPAIVPMATLVADGLPADVAADWVTHRKARRAVLTHAAWDGLKREAGKAGWDVQTACVLAMQRGWTGFSASWLERENRDNERHKQRNGAETPYQRAQRQVMAEFVPGVAAHGPIEDVTDVHDTSHRPRI